MRIAYISSSYVPSRRASAVHVMKMCASFTQAGHKVQLVVKKNPQRVEDGVKNVFQFYDVTPAFEITQLPRPSMPGGGLIYGACLVQLLRRRVGIDLVYTRDSAGGILAARMRVPFVYEIHGVPETRLGRLLVRSITRSRSLQRLVVISTALLNDLIQEDIAPRDPRRIIVAHDAADPPRSEGSAERFEHPASNSSLHVGYVGSLYSGRGIDRIIQIARILTDVAFHIVGGTESDLARWTRTSIPRNLKFHGFISPSRVPGVLQGFDILLMPHQRSVLAATGRSDISRWTSPLKMFEYMASARPVIASRLPVLQEVLEDGRNALLVDPDDIDEWIAAIRRLQTDPDLRIHLGAAALHDLLTEYTWSRRAERVISGLEFPAAGRSVYADA